jgi:hypothetical protein
MIMNMFIEIMIDIKTVNNQELLILFNRSNLDILLRYRRSILIEVDAGGLGEGTS